jgi:hypothetical protein
MQTKDIADTIFAAAFVASFDMHHDAKEAYSRAAFVASKYKKENERREDARYAKLEADIARAKEQKP